MALSKDDIHVARPGDGIAIVQRVILLTHIPPYPKTYDIHVVCPLCNGTSVLRGIYLEKQILVITCCRCNKKFDIYRNMFTDRMKRQEDGEHLSSSKVEVVKDGIIRRKG